MVNFNSLLMSALVAVVWTVASGQPDKLASCCTKVTKVEITEPILGYLTQEANYPCVKAVIFQTEAGLYCSHVHSPWVRRKILQLRRAKAQSKSPSVVSQSPSPSPVSLLSIITSTSSPPSASSLNPSSSSPVFPSVSTVSSGDMFSGSDEEETFMSSAGF